MYTFKIGFLNGSSTPLFKTLEEAKRVFDYYKDYGKGVIYITAIRRIGK